MAKINKCICISVYIAGCVIGTQGLRMSAPAPHLSSPKAHNLQTKEPFHVHFGGGKIGLGLICPTIEESGIPFALVDIPSFGEGLCPKFEVNVNGDTIAELELTNDKDINELGHRSMFVEDDPERLVQVASRATSFSCSLGPVLEKVIVPLLSQIPRLETANRPLLFACENDHTAIQKVAKALDGKVEVVPCMIDRICTDQERNCNAVEVSTEPYLGSIVPLTLPTAGKPLPFAGERVTFPKSSKEAKFFYDRKVFLVNGMHTTLAFMTLRHNQPDETKMRDMPLLTMATASRDQKKEIWAWAMVRCMMLIDKHGMDTLFKAYHTNQVSVVFNELAAFAEQSLGRFSTVDDTTARVLNGGVGVRWSGRLKPAMDFLVTVKDDSQAMKFLKWSQLRKPAVQNIVNSLVLASEKYHK